MLSCANWFYFADFQIRQTGFDGVFYSAADLSDRILRCLNTGQTKTALVSVYLDLPDSLSLTVPFVSVPTSCDENNVCQRVFDVSEVKMST